MYNNKQKCGIHLQFAESGYICGFRLQVLRVLVTFCGVHIKLRNPEQLAIFACCGILNKKNVPAKFTLRIFEQGIL